MERYLSIGFVQGNDNHQMGNEADQTDWIRPYFNQPASYSAYFESHREFKVKTIGINPKADAELIVAHMADIDGLGLGGGGHIPPGLYDQPHAHIPEDVKAVMPEDAMRTIASYAIGKLALRRGVPILGICQGAQLINVVQGGTLYQSLKETPPIEQDKMSVHLTTGREALKTRHDIRFLPGTELLNKFSGAVSVITSHDQAVDKLGEGLLVRATAEDGIIEWIDVDNDNPDLSQTGVQFHPEEDSNSKLSHFILGKFLLSAALVDRPIYTEQDVSYVEGVIRMAQEKLRLAA